MAINHKLSQTLYSDKVGVAPGTRVPFAPQPVPPAPAGYAPVPAVPPPGASGVGPTGFTDSEKSQTNGDLGKLARDAQKIFNKIPVIEHRTLEDFYREPITLGQLAEEPFSIELVRIVNLFAQTTPTPTGGMCHFTWLPASGGAVIASIDGMSVAINGTTKFRFFFRITYKME